MQFRKPGCFQVSYEFDNYVESYTHLTTLLVTKSSVRLFEKLENDHNMYSTLIKDLSYNLG